MLTVDLTELGPLALADFGTPVVYMPKAGGSFAVNGVYDNAFREVDLSSDAPVAATVYPALGVNLADFPSAPLQGDRLTVTETGITYVVRESRPDSHGWVILILNRVSGV